jgi:hypothetical protein
MKRTIEPLHQTTTGDLVRTTAPLVQLTVGALVLCTAPGPVGGRRGRGGFSSTFVEPQVAAGGRRLELLLPYAHRFSGDRRRGAGGRLSTCK